jgi:hypothetical protein
MVPARKATSGLLADKNLTNTMPATEHNKPVEANAKGKNIKDSRLPKAPTAIVEAMAMVAIIEPQ